MLKNSVLILTGLHVRLVRLAGVYGGPEYVVRYRNAHSGLHQATRNRCELDSPFAS